MVQVKKPGVRDAILASARALFSTHGYHATTLTEIARRAGIGVGNVYSYFPSKLHILYEVYRPWFTAKLDALDAELEDTPEPRERLRLILRVLWQDIPSTDPWLANSLMEALATADPEGGKPDHLLLDAERRLTGMFRSALPSRRHDLLEGDLLANLCLMAFDGFVINRRLQDLRDTGQMIDLVVDLLQGPDEISAVAQGSRSAKTA